MSRAMPRRAASGRHPPARTAAPVVTDESPLDWLARRRGRDGTPLITPAQQGAGERLRRDFTQAGLTPRVTANWSALGTGAAGAAGSPGSFSDVVLAAKTRFALAMRALGPELSGTVVDVCCFLKGLETVESERRWPPRTAKVVLGLGLDRLARHYGLASQAQGRGTAPTRAWHAGE